MQRLSLAFLLVLFIPNLSFSNERPTLQTYIMCKNGKGVRTLRMHRPSENQNCIVTYTKGGADTIVANGKYAAFCEKQFKDIESKLLSNNWKCRDISPAMVHTGGEGMLNDGNSNP